MAGITLADAEAQLAAWLTASAAVAQNQSYTIESGGSRRTLTRADASEIRAQIDFWDKKAKELTVIGVYGSRRRTRYVVPE
jgi:hypothetical protein